MNGMETIQFDRVTNALCNHIKTSNFWSSAEIKKIQENHRKKVNHIVPLDMSKISLQKIITDR